MDLKKDNSSRFNYVERWRRVLAVFYQSVEEVEQRSLGAEPELAETLPRLAAAEPGGSSGLGASAGEVGIEPAAPRHGERAAHPGGPKGHLLPQQLLLEELSSDLRPDHRLLHIPGVGAALPEGSAAVGGEFGQLGRGIALRRGFHRRLLPLQLGLYRAERGCRLPLRIRAGVRAGGDRRIDWDVHRSPGLQAAAVGVGLRQSPSQRATERRGQSGGRRQRIEGGGFGQTHTHSLWAAECSVLDYQFVSSKLSCCIFSWTAAHSAFKFLLGNNLAHNGRCHSRTEC